MTFIVRGKIKAAAAAAPRLWVNVTFLGHSTSLCSFGRCHQVIFSTVFVALPQSLMTSLFLWKLGHSNAFSFLLSLSLSHSFSFPLSVLLPFLILSRSIISNSFSLAPFCLNHLSYVTLSLSSSFYLYIFSHLSLSLSLSVCLSSFNFTFH